MRAFLTKRSGNVKTGPIAVSITEKNSCPSECPLLNGDCYARFGPLAIHWNKVSNGIRGMSWPNFCKALKGLVAGTLFRHNQAGDLPQNKRGKIDKNKMRSLVASVRHLKGWTYTHYDPTDPHNADAIRHANKNGFTVNLSADNLTEADAFCKLGVGPVTVTLPSDSPTIGVRTPEGRVVSVCPAQTCEHVTCATCKLCQISGRKSIVGFLAHGTAKKRLSRRLENE